MFALVLAAAPARADVAADIKQAFTAFVDGVGKKQLGKVELFITPIDVAPKGVLVDDSSDVPVPPRDKLAAVAAVIPKPVVTVTAVVPAPSGKSAWLTAEISPDGKPRSQKLRASAFLVRDGSAWRVTATHWSATVPDQPLPPGEGCGCADFSWNPKSNVPSALLPIVKPLFAYPKEDGLAPFRTLLSDDKRASVFGSAPNEVFVGGAKVKAIFQRWKVNLMTGSADAPLPARAGGDGELIWLDAGANPEMRFCTSYRAMFILAKERAGWRIVHQHYSKPTS